MSLRRIELEPPNERQGEYIRTSAYVWHCEDDGEGGCDCSQVVVERLYRNALARSAYWPVRIAEGTYVSRDGGYAGMEAREAEIAEAEEIAANDNPTVKP